VSTTRFILVVLILASPAILLWDGLITQGLVAGMAAIALLITSGALRPAEAGFLTSVIRPLLVIVAVPTLWILIQTLPLSTFAHPIWTSAEVALAHPLAGAISIDRGTSVLALGQYLSLAAVAFLSAAVAIDRQRAEWLLFALTIAVSAVALIALADDLYFSWLVACTRAEAIDCASVGTIIASAACIRSVERAESRRESSQQSVSALARTFVASRAAVALCAAALLLDRKPPVLFATGYGLFALAGVMIIRRFGFGPLGIIGLVGPALAVAILLLSAHPSEHGTSLLLTFAAPASPALLALSEHMLGDAPLVGTGAGSFAALAPIYRQINDPSVDCPPTTVAALAIELGRPVLWVIVAATTAAVVMLLRASLHRGRDSLYPAMGGSCMITLLLLAFTNAGLSGTAIGLITATAVGLAFAQSKSRPVQR
jgi:hypothetical protein